jgi:Flp pilus assembly protein TadG
MNIRPEKKIIFSEGGASAVEFAIVLPLLLLIVFGTIEFGILLFNKQVITNASREGARAGIVAGTPRKTDAEITTVVNQYNSNHLITFGTPEAPDITISRTGTVFGDDLTVIVEYHYDFLVLPNFATNLIGGTDIVASTVMKYE